MPIDLAQLRARTAEVAARFSDPPACAAALHRLLLDYADRSYRQSPRLADSAPANVLMTPAPVTRAILAALRGPAQAAPPQALALARAAWASGAREERRIAAELLGWAAAGSPGEAAALLEAWLPEIESGETADALAKFGLGPLAGPAVFELLPRVRAWARHPNRWVRRFSVAVLGALAHDRRWDDVPVALDILRGLMAEADPGLRQAVSAALQALVPRSPDVVVAFLRDQAARPDHNTHLILRATLRALPRDAQADLIRVMRA